MCAIGKGVLQQTPATSFMYIAVKVIDGWMDTEVRGGRIYCQHVRHTLQCDWLVAVKDAAARMQRQRFFVKPKTAVPATAA